ncbi:MAG: transporter [Candidatus Brocadia sp.]|nr:MAG: transporter [Candidatus Brocadia sp.]
MINHGYKFFVFVPFLMLFLNNVEANHGPGTGGGATTIPALTLKSGAFSVSLRTELTEFESISNPKLLRKAEEAGAFDVIDRTFLHTIDMGYGITDDLTIGLGIGWFETINFREGEFEDDEVEIFQANPDGITDLWLSGKYRFWRGPQGHYAIIAGVKFPTGVDDKKNSEGEKIETVEQPGSGSYDFATGFAYSRWLTEKWTLDTNIQYTYRTEGARDFEIGDRMDWNLATAYQVIQRNKYPNFAPVGEINVRYLFRDEEDGEDIRDSGGTTVFFSPGLRIGVTSRFGVGASVSFPVFQNLLGEQQETDLKAIVGVNYSF